MWKHRPPLASPGGAVAAALRSPPRRGGVGIGRERGPYAGAHRLEAVEFLARLVDYIPARPYRFTLLAGTAAWVAGQGSTLVEIPRRLTLDPCSPNPARAGSALRIRFGLPQEARVRLEVFNVAGQRVATSLDDAPFEAGFHAVFWDGRVGGKGAAVSVVCFYGLQVGQARFTRRVAFLR